MTDHRPGPPRPTRRGSGSGPPIDTVWAALESILDGGDADRVLEVVDVGGGSGVQAVRIAERGHRVTVVDPSPNALATLERRARDAGVIDRIVAIQGDAGGLAGLVPAGGADLVLCHGVLDVVDDPVEAIAQVAALAAPDALVSVVVAARHGAVVSRVIAGHIREAMAILQSSEGTYGGADPLPRRFTVDGLVGLLADAGLAVRQVRGVRTFGDLVGGGLDDGSVGTAEVAKIDAMVSGDAAFQSLAATLHLTALRSAAPS